MWRVISLESHPAAENMAIDETIGNELCEGRSQPTIRFYTWRSPAVSIGYFQCIRDEVDIAACQSGGVDYVRRRTGGGAVYHDPAGEITYSIIAPESYFPNGIRESYDHICSCMISGLFELGIDASFRPINDVTVDGRKISGSAQTRRKGVLTQHGTILFQLDREAMFSVLKPPKAKLADKPFKRFEDGVTSVSELCDATKEELYHALLRGFTRAKEWRYGTLTDHEQLLVPALKDKYVSDTWNFSR
ncbi:MAG TPA: biotin/lipoate A/B protein ligase family protein [Methanocellaceae archaeon]